MKTRKDEVSQKLLQDSDKSGLQTRDFMLVKFRTDKHIINFVGKMSKNVRMKM